MLNMEEIGFPKRRALSALLGFTTQNTIFLSAEV
jgi:hypothetical protein